MNHISEYSRKESLKVFSPKPEVVNWEGNRWITIKTSAREYHWWSDDGYSIADSLKIAGATNQIFESYVDIPQWAGEIGMDTIDLPTCRDCPYSQIETFSKVSCGCNVYPGKYEGSRFVCEKFVFRFDSLHGIFEQFEKLREEKKQREEQLRRRIEESRVYTESVISKIKGWSGTLDEMKLFWTKEIDFSKVNQSLKGKLEATKNEKKQELVTKELLHAQKKQQRISDNQSRKATQSPRTSQKGIAPFRCGLPEKRTPRRS